MIIIITQANQIINIYIRHRFIRPNEYIKKGREVVVATSLSKKSGIYSFIQKSR